MTGRSLDVSSDDELSSDVTRSSVRRRHNKDEDSDVPKFFYGRASDTIATGRGRQLQTDDVSTSRVSRDTSTVGGS